MPHTTRWVFHIENLYLSIGDEFESLLGELNWANLDAFGDKSAGELFLLAMVTAFQFAEKLSDRAAADALRQRTDWKYALDLPLDYPGLDPAELAGFRRRLRANAEGRQVFRRMLAHLGQIGLLGSGAKGGLSATAVLRAIDMRNRVEGLAEAMRLALEDLAATHPEWLQANSLPHWVERYGPRRETGRQLYLEEQEEQLAAFQNDITYLLGAVARSGLTDLARMPEIKTLQALAAKSAAWDAVS
jgi:hypothetical protein